jgi:hypothetical protein
MNIYEVQEQLEHNLEILRELNKPGSDSRNRQLSLAITALEEAILRLGESTNPAEGWE